MRRMEREFRRLCSEINSEGKATVTVFWERQFADDAKYAEAWVDYSVRPQRIYIQKNPRYSKPQSFKDMIFCLLHEYGHVMDDIAYRGCRRLRTFNKYRFDDTELADVAEKYPRWVKLAFLKTEYIAEKWIRRLLNRFDVPKDLISEKDINICNMWTMKMKKYQWKYGKHASRAVQHGWAKQLKRRAPVLTWDYVKDLERI